MAELLAAVPVLGKEDSPSIAASIIQILMGAATNNVAAYRDDVDCEPPLHESDVVPSLKYNVFDIWHWRDYIYTREQGNLVVYV